MHSFFRIIVAFLQLQYAAQNNILRMMFTYWLISYWFTL